ncbi:MAG: exonuclease domain-containing protein [Oscillospiraceae bacterium]
MIVFDLEWNSGYGKARLDEILQIGAVRLDRLGGRITGTFNVLIRPSVHKKLGVAAKEILDMQTLRNAELNFPQALVAFLQWCGNETEFAAWGGSDMEVLRQNCTHWKLPMPTWEKVYDLQASFSALLGTAQSVALYRAVEYCGIPDCLDCHNALCDAVYTAIIGEWVAGGGTLLEALPRRVQRLSHADFPKQERRRVGPFPSWEAALDSRDSRRATCPQCGKRIWVKTWHYRFSQQAYADFCCPEHGWFLCRLTLARQEDGIWRGRQTVPVLTRSLIWEFHAATKSNSYACTTTGKKRRRRRTARKRATGAGIAAQSG